MSNQETFERYLKKVFDTLQNQKLEIRPCPAEDSFDFMLSYKLDERNLDEDDVTFNKNLAQNKSSILNLCRKILQQQRPNKNIQLNRNLLEGQEINWDLLEVYLAALDDQLATPILREMTDLVAKRSRLVDFQTDSPLYGSTQQQDSTVREALTRLEDDIRAKFNTYFNSLQTQTERDQVKQWGVIGVPTQDDSLSTSASSSGPMSVSSASHTNNEGGSSSSSVDNSSNQQQPLSSSMSSSSSSRAGNGGAKDSVEIGKRNSSNTSGTFSFFPFFRKNNTEDETSTTSIPTMSDNVNDLVVDNPQTLEQLNPALKRVMKEIKQEEEKVKRYRLQVVKLGTLIRQLSNKPRNEHREAKINTTKDEARRKLELAKMSETRIGILKKKMREYLHRRKELMANSSKPR